MLIPVHADSCPGRKCSVSGNLKPQEEDSGSSRPVSSLVPSSQEPVDTGDTAQLVAFIPFFCPSPHKILSYFCVPPPCPSPQDPENASEPLFALLSRLSSYLGGTSFLDMRNCIQRDHITHQGHTSKLVEPGLERRSYDCKHSFFLLRHLVPLSAWHCISWPWEHCGECMEAIEVKRDQMQRKNDKKELKL